MTPLRPLAVATVVALAAGLAGLIGPASSGAAAADDPCAAWMDRHDSPSARARALVSAMSLDQQLHMVTFGDRPPYLLYYGTAGHVTGIPELCVPDLVLSDAGSGVAGLQVSTTTFPSGVAQASTWDPRLQRRVGRAIGEEAHQKGINVMLGPGMNIARTPYNGRNFEYFGEDPYLTSQMVVPFIEGIQDNPVVADAKHFVLNDQETDRMTVDVHVDERTMREIYLPPFEASVQDARVGSVMCSYNRVGGDYACENPDLLTGILRDDWGFDGFVVSDWGAVHSTAPSATAGLDLEMHAVPFAAPSTPVYGGGGRSFGASDLQAALADGSLSRARLADMVRDIVRPMFRLGLFDDPVSPSLGGYLSDASTPEHLATARRVASEATVLLKNRHGLLPLGGDGRRTIAVIGYAANPLGAASTTGGGGSSHGSGLPPSVVSPLQGILQVAAARGDRVVYAEGSSIADARAVAAAADVAVVVASDGSSEGSDRTDLGMEPNACVALLCTRLPLQQEEMVDAVTAANPASVVVLDVGGPVRMPWLDDAGAVLVTWYAGVQHGTSLARVLYGEDEPGGRLPQTFPVSEKQVTMGPEQYPGVDGRESYTERLEVGYRWYDARHEEPLFPFGFGLGYTTFDYRDLAVRRSGSGAVARFTIRNTGDRTGAAVPQVYVGAPRAAGEPPWQLKGFDKLRLRPGQSSRVTIRLDRRAFSQWSTARHDWVVTPGRYPIAVGRSSRDLPLRSSVSMR